MIRNDDLGYPILVGDNLKPEIQTFLAARGGRFVVVCDATVAPLARQLTERVSGRIAVLPFELGEARKNLATVNRVLDGLAAHSADRDTLVLGVGGGVANDLFGFAASIFLRGVAYAHVATTLLAMVDAAIGGKTGVDLPAGKNLAGTFTDPVAVFCAVEALWTLPYCYLRDGLAEVIKHAIIEGGDTFDSLETLAPHPFFKWPWETIIADSLKVKTMVVNDDRLERGAREVLNLGHTFAHGIETASSYRVSHGAAVSVGLRAAGLLALQTGRFSTDEHVRVLTLLALLRLPMVTKEDPAAILRAMDVDKKKRAGRLRFVVPRALGDVEFGVHAAKSTVRRVLGRCTSAPTDREFLK